MNSVLSTFKIMELKEKLRYLRQMRGYTQEYVAEKLGIDAVNYGRLERGEAKLTVERLVDLLNIFEISVQDFFIGKDFETLPPQLPQTEILEYLKKIYEEVSEINKKMDNNI